jgi:hypothetical protein
MPILNYIDIKEDKELVDEYFDPWIEVLPRLVNY